MAKTSKQGKADQATLEAAKAIMQTHLALSLGCVTSSIEAAVGFSAEGNYGKAAINRDVADMHRATASDLQAGIKGIDFLLGYFDRFGTV